MLLNAPNSWLTGSQAVEKRKLMPNSLIEGIEFQTKEIKMPAMMIKINPAQAAVTARNSKSVLRLVFQP